MSTPPNTSDQPQKQFIKPPAYARFRWLAAGFALIALDGYLLSRVIDGNKFALIYGILFGFVLLVSLAWVVFTPAVLGLRKKKK